MENWVSEVTDEAIKMHWGVPALARGRSYLTSGHTIEYEIVGDDLIARVGSSTGRFYDARVHNDPSGLESKCTCVTRRSGCKHAVAALLAARDAMAPAPMRAWETQVLSLLPPTGPEVTGVIGLEFAIRKMEGEESIALRPATRRSQGWIRGKLSWADLETTAPESRWDPAQWNALRQLLHLLPEVPSGTWITLRDLGPLVWPILRHAEAVGVVLLPGDGLRNVDLARKKAQLWLKVAEEPSGAVRLVVTGSVGEGPIGGRRLLIGRPAHGIGELAPGGLLRLYQLEEPPPEGLWVLVSGQGSIDIPAEDADRFRLLYLPVLSRNGLLGHAPASEAARPNLRLHIRHDAGPAIVLQWGFTYERDGATADVPLKHEIGGPPRDRVAESSLEYATSRLLRDQRGVTDAGELVDGIELQGVAAARFCTEAVPRLEAAGINVEHEGEIADFTRVAEALDIVLTTEDTQDRDWFNLHIEVRVADREVPLEDLLRALAAGDDAILLGDGTWFDLDRPQLNRLRQLIEEARALGDGADELRLNPYQLGLWNEFAEVATQQHRSERWAQRLEALLRAGAEPAKPPRGLKAKLRPYQCDGLAWLASLWDADLGGVLADDMGLGKTVQALALFERARERGDLDDQAILVVAPASVVGTWADEAERFAPKLKVAVISATEARRGTSLADEIAGAHVVVTSYTLLRLEEEQYLSQSWRGLVLDEAQFVKNHRSRTHQAAARIGAPFTLAVTGTPLENSLADLWAIFTLAAPGLFPRMETFTERYRGPIEADGDSAVLGRLRSRIRPFLLRRTKRQVVAELPPKTEQVVRVELTDAHRSVYEQHLTRERVRVLGMLDDLVSNKVAILSALTRLRQLALDPRLIEEAAPPTASAKIDTLIEHLVELVDEGHRALVFSSFTGFLGLVRDALEDAGVGHVYLDGRTRDRRGRIAEFRRGDDPVFLISLKAGGVGLTLTEADYVFVLDPWWNPAAENQAIDRAHRIGQNRAVNVYRLVAADTIEEKVVALQQRKRELFETVVESGEYRGGAITVDDIRALLE